MSKLKLEAVVLHKKVREDRLETQYITKDPEDVCSEYQKQFDNWYEALPQFYGKEGAIALWMRHERNNTHQGRLIIEGPIKKPCEHPTIMASHGFKCYDCGKWLRPTGWEEYK